MWMVAGIVLGVVWSGWRWWRGAIHVQSRHVSAKCGSVAEWRRTGVGALAVGSVGAVIGVPVFIVLNWRGLTATTPLAVVFSVTMGLAALGFYFEWVRIIAYVVSPRCWDEAETILRERKGKAESGKDGGSGKRK